MNKKEITTYIYQEFIKALNNGVIKKTEHRTIYEVAEYGANLINDYKVANNLENIESLAVVVNYFSEECDSTDVDIYFWQRNELFKLELLSIEVEGRLIERNGVKKII